MRCPRPPDPHTPQRTWSPTCLSRGASPRAMAAWQDEPSGRKRRAPHLNLPRGPWAKPGTREAGSGRWWTREAGSGLPRSEAGQWKAEAGQEAPRQFLLVLSTAGSDLGSAPPPGRGQWEPHPSRPPRTRDSRLQPTRGLTSWSPDSTAPRASREAVIREDSLESAGAGPGPVRAGGGR